jgi:hypothetical protein
MNATDMPWVRPALERAQPIRTAGGFYRTAEETGAGEGRGGQPLNNVDDAVIAAVRLAYRVADKQVERSTRLARQLRQAGRKAAGPTAERDALDAMERLVLKTVLSGLSWWEGSVADGRCPVRRLAAAEYRMLGSILGLVMPERGSNPASPASGFAAGFADPAARGGDTSSAAADATPRGNGTASAAADARQQYPGGQPPHAATDAAPTPPPPAQPAIEIVHEGDVRRRRFIESKTFVLAAAGASSETFELFFQHAQHSGDPLTATLEVDASAPARLRFGDINVAAPGLWRAVICGAGGVQRGYIEIAL